MTVDDEPIPINVYVDELTEHGRAAIRTALDLKSPRRVAPQAGVLNRTSSNRQRD